jgi:hypothetical protein
MVKLGPGDPQPKYGKQSEAFADDLGDGVPEEVAPEEDEEDDDAEEEDEFRDPFIARGARAGGEI